MSMPRKYESRAQKQAAYRLRCKQRELVGNCIPSTPGRRRWRAMLGQSLYLVEQAGREMEAYHDQRSESWQESEQGEAFAEVMEMAAEIASALREIPPM